MKIKLALAEDNPNLAESIRNNLSLGENIELLFVACNGKDLLQKITLSVPDIILMDINMPVMDGIEATRKVKHHFPDVKIIMLTVFDDEDKIFQSILAGATGYLLKDEKPGKIFAALEDAMDGGAPMSSSIALKTLQLLRGKNTGQRIEKNEFKLTKREIEVLELVAKGNNYNVIADALFSSPKTVRKHIENIYSKMQVHNKMEAVRLATDKKIILPLLFFLP